MSIEHNVHMSISNGRVTFAIDGIMVRILFAHEIDENKLGIIENMLSRSVSKHKNSPKAQ